MQIRLLLLLLVFTSAALTASELDTWGLETEEDNSNIWSDYAEAKPDIYPDGWMINKLAKFEGDETQLRSSNGALLRWVSSQQLKDLNQAFNKIEKVSETKATLYLVQGNAPNASAGTRENENGVMENIVLVNFSMLDMIGDNQSLWAALLGHELAHLKLSHGEKRAKRNLPISILKNIGKSVVSNPLGNAASGLFFDSVGATFSRTDETQADYMGVIWAIEAGYDPFGAVELHKRMNDSGSKFNIPFLSNHPSGPERIKALEALATRLSQRP